MSENPLVAGEKVVLDDGRIGKLATLRGCYCGPLREACWYISLGNGTRVQADGGTFRRVPPEKGNDPSICQICEKELPAGSSRCYVEDGLKRRICDECNQYLWVVCSDQTYGRRPKSVFPPQVMRQELGLTGRYPDPNGVKRDGRPTR